MPVMQATLTSGLAGLSPRAARRWGTFAAPLARRMLQRLALVSPMNATEAARLSALCPGLRLGPMADLKATAACAPCSADGAALAHGVAAARNSGRFVWLAASTHAGEEDIAAAAHAALSAGTAAAGPLTLIAPRHPERGQAIAATLAAAHPSLRIVLHSASSTASLAGADVYVVDALGLLPALYAACGVAFVGNSLTPFGGGHNLAEAAAAGAAVLHGPRLGPFADMAAALCSLSGELTALQCVADASELAAALVALRDAPAQAAARGAAAALSARQMGDGVLQPVLHAVEALLAQAGAVCDGWLRNSSGCGMRA
jgi:3-deoxy-D-manno-octulosonic-acid transferase